MESCKLFLFVKMAEIHGGVPMYIKIVYSNMTLTFFPLSV